MKKELIAPCGMNCGICLGYLRETNKCPGCFSGRKVSGKPIKCSRRLCKKREGDFCFQCKEFPCKSIKKLDERYRERYGMSEIENLLYIKEHGLEAFLKKEEEKWATKEGTLCVHDKKFYKPKK